MTRENEKLALALREERLERAIGVIYRPQTERLSHYFRARLSDQFDAVMHFDQTRAVEPLERTARWEAGELPETYPYGLRLQALSGFTSPLEIRSRPCDQTRAGEGNQDGGWNRRGEVKAGAILGGSVHITLARLEGEAL